MEAVKISNLSYKYPSADEYSEERFFFRFGGRGMRDCRPERLRQNNDLQYHPRPYSVFSRRRG